ncbi:poly-beta-1,6-N-acetyl-D-glucosamine biosynthesis protein PgaD [Acinetobacter puyangensis]|uniref:Poly-beta-1,6-N-acetyl-D-glucosamine biosynthesis protein PgaD n=1 Tax=Acinetobacter puyangensis TaxID=1096779 RepID=A0A240EDB4_9GAMM|nr:poly-beta-1,6-N-acetyl-D-glucosamine biosynthesis protein PgaD [Acinetobacter puyangensis]SNX46546.1 poly-beta-1,6-N-acetyl-D-glucosamine biosynthesis protein PgaD [Acinetobacter puyangensis]
MKNHSLIIDIRHQLPWHRRYMSNTTTALLWASWLLLWRPMMILLGIIGVQNHHIVHHLLMLFLTALEKGVIMLVVCALLLLLWNNFVPFKPFKRVAAKNTQDYAQHFALDTQHLQHCRQQKITVVHYDETGKITEID